MSMLDEYCFIKTDGENPDFARLCDKLDQNLDEQAVACGSYKYYDKETVELKRIFTD